MYSQFCNEESADIQETRHSRDQTFKRPDIQETRHSRDQTSSFIEAQSENCAYFI
jgi:hypothetical protein